MLTLDGLVGDTGRLLDVDALREALGEVGPEVARQVEELACEASHGAPVPSGVESEEERQEWRLVLTAWLVVGQVVGLRAAGVLAPDNEVRSVIPLRAAWNRGAAVDAEHGPGAMWAGSDVDALSFEARVRVLCSDTAVRAWMFAPTFATIGGDWALIVARWFTNAVATGLRAAAS